MDRSAAVLVPAGRPRHHQCLHGLQRRLRRTAHAKSGCFPAFNIQTATDIGPSLVVNGDHVVCSSPCHAPTATCLRLPLTHLEIAAPYSLEVGTPLHDEDRCIFALPNGNPITRCEDCGGPRLVRVIRLVRSARTKALKNRPRHVMAGSAWASSPLLASLSASTSANSDL